MKQFTLWLCDQVDPKGRVNSYDAAVNPVIIFKQSPSIVTLIIADPEMV